MKKASVLLALSALAPFALAACGSSSSSSSSSTTPASSSTTSSSTTPAAGGGGGATIAVSADPSGALAFQQSSLTAKSGSDTFDFTNDSSLTHTFCIETSSGQQVGCSAPVTGGKTTLSANLKPGKYTFYCSIDSHRQSGMEGTLTVN